jgi:protein-S-isoprenylcysteine O-methyltransferase Ste14
MFADHFANHRIAWSRVVIVTALLLVVFGSPAKGPHTLLAELGELLGFALLVAATLWRIWCAIFIVGSKNAELAASGPYSVVRNPLYIGNLIGAVGFGFAVHMPGLALLLALAFAVFYPSVVANEERRLAALFGERYSQYCARVPRWIPDASLYQEADSVTVSPRRVRGAIFDAMWFLWAFALWEFIEELHEVNLLPTLF